MEKIEAIERLRNAARLSDTYNISVAWIYHNEKNVFIHPNLGKELNLPEVIEIGSKDHKEWLRHRPLFNKVLDQEIWKDCDQYPCLR